MDFRNPPASTSASALPEMRVKKLEKESELRIEVGETPFKLRLLDGTAEIFGTDLPQASSFTFPPGHKFAVFTRHGATIGVYGAAETEYTANETPVVSYINVNKLLTNRRNRAKESVSDDYNTSQGPRAIVVGPKASGRSTLSRMLISWAVKLGWNPTLVDLDVGKGSITIPGCIAAMEIDAPIDPVEGVPDADNNPIYYFFGHTNPCQNVELYKILMKQLAKLLERRFAFDLDSRTAGMVINTVGWKEGLGIEQLLLHVIETFNANVVFVLGQDKLFSMLSNKLRNRPDMDVVKLRKSGGVVSRNKAAREKARSDRMRQYFYGLKKDLNPHYYVAKFSDLCVYRIADGQQATSSALQIGAQPGSSPLKVVPVDFGQQLVHQILAISFSMETDKIITRNVDCFICIVAVDMDRKKIAYLSPSRGELASKNLIMGSLAWVDEEQ